MGDNEVTFNAEGGEIVEKSELKPGYVLFEDLFDKVGMKAGYVLSSSDIEKIQNSDKVDTLKVLKTDKLQEEAVEAVPTEEDLKEIDISVEDRKQSISNPKYDQKLKQVVSMKKKMIRGENYQKRVDEHKQEKLKKFNDVLKTIHTHQKEQTLQVIDEYAKSAADMDGLETIEAKQAAELVNRLDNYEKNTVQFLEGVLHQKKVFSSFIEEIVVDFVNDVGYELANALFASISKIDSYMDYLAAHSLQVMVVALVTAIEMTKMIKEKSDKVAATDLNTFLAISKKFFSLEDLVNLGIGALLHDVEIRNKYPNLTWDQQADYAWDSIMDLHPSNGFHICKKVNIDFDVQRSVYQHHERFDGSGYPNGLYPRFFSKYTPILMFAEHFVEMTTFNPFVDKIQPSRDALVSLLSNERKKFDGDVIYAFIRSASLFPIGSWLLLSDGHIGVVMDVNKDELERPILKVFFDKTLNRVEPFVFDLKGKEVKIVKPIDLYTIKRMAGDSMNFIFSDV